MENEQGCNIQKADPIEYIKFALIYRKNVWFRAQSELVREMMIQASECYWLRLGEIRVGGVHLSNYKINALFIIPPYQLSEQIVQSLIQFVSKTTDKLRNIDAFEIDLNQIDAFNKAGFNIVKSRKCMIRPTGHLVYDELDSQFSIHQPNKKNVALIARLLFHAHEGGEDEKEYSHHYEDLMDYFHRNKSSKMLKTSTLVTDQDTNAIIGACLITLWEKVPLIYEIVVDPSYRNRGIGQYLLYRSIDLLYDYPYLRLFVSDGNPAEEMYRKMGFATGESRTHMQYMSIKRKVGYHESI